MAKVVRMAMSMKSLMLMLLAAVCWVEGRTVESESRLVSTTPHPHDVTTTPNPDDVTTTDVPTTTENPLDDSNNAILPDYEDNVDEVDGEEEDGQTLLLGVGSGVVVVLILVVVGILVFLKRRRSKHVQLAKDESEVKEPLTNDVDSNNTTNKE